MDTEQTEPSVCLLDLSAGCPNAEPPSTPVLQMDNVHSLPDNAATERGVIETDRSCSQHSPQQDGTIAKDPDFQEFTNPQDVVLTREAEKRAIVPFETETADAGAVEILESYLSQRNLEDMSSMNSDTDSGESEEVDSEPEPESVEAEPRLAEVVAMEDMEASRQRMLREIAVHDRIGGNDIPEARAPTDLIAALQKKRDDAIRRAQELRAPFEKFQDFDAFIDELTITDDHSWKTVEITRTTT